MKTAGNISCSCDAKQYVTVSMLQACQEEQLNKEISYVLLHRITMGTNEAYDQNKLDNTRKKRRGKHKQKTQQKQTNDNLKKTKRINN